MSLETFLKLKKFFSPSLYRLLNVPHSLTVYLGLAFCYWVGLGLTVTKQGLKRLGGDTSLYLPSPLISQPPLPFPGN